MNAVKHILAIALCAVVALLPSSSIAQQVTGELGSPNAATTIPGNQLPAPDPHFGGVIKEKASESTPWWPPRIVPPKGAPNVLLIMTDDEGFGAPSTFGGVIETPALYTDHEIGRVIRAVDDMGERLPMDSFLRIHSALSAPRLRRWSWSPSYALSYEK